MATPEPCSPSVHIAVNVDDLSATLAAYIAVQSANAIAARGHFAVAFSGGSLPVLAATGLLSPILSPPIQWDKWLVFFSDERIVPLDSPESNYKAVHDALLSKVPIPATHVFPIKASLSAAEAALAYESDMAATLAAHAGGVLDLVLLGLGPDGHTCSLFPGHALVVRPDAAPASAHVAAITDSPKPPAQRITLTLAALHASRALAFACAGAGKASVVRQVLQRRVGEVLLPAAVAGGDSRASWFIDATAAADLDSPFASL